jgi:hypothetical protein
MGTWGYHGDVMVVNPPKIDDFFLSQLEVSVYGSRVCADPNISKL